ncbi:MAG: lipid IV(A) 3-deoxy-D-manno-octulosonic acid transferase [Endozoicomonas sp. (ex Botrylloides leachii)]|nr:lipid IV(A) 3-deoxy-D-manno-octulosonic acid transferase [Endozoicomonas sp. (ex Botrylloides leachii)]
MARFIYSCLLYLITPAVLLRMLWRSRKTSAYRKRWGERLGFSPRLTRQNPVIWVHAVSVGETIASASLIKALQRHYPDHYFLITTMTPSGSERVKAIHGNALAHSYIPYDLPCALSRFLNRTSPCIAIMIETELWPNTIAACNKRNIPVIVANARLSKYSAKGYSRFGWITRPMLQQLSIVACQHTDDGERFLNLGLQKEKLHITGNIKFDIQVSEETKRSAAELRTSWEKGFGKPAQIFIASSTHAGEEQLIIDAFIQLKHQHRDLLLVLVPRHPERFNTVFQQAYHNGLNTIRYSQHERVSFDTDIILGDTMGEMMKFFSASDIAFVGGSLIERGGHNVLEPAAVGLPILTGAYTFNFQDITSSLEKARGLIRVRNANDLIIEINKLLMDKHYQNNIGNNAKYFVENNQGALNRLLSVIIRQIATKTTASTVRTN